MSAQNYVDDAGSEIRANLVTNHTVTTPQRLANVSVSLDNGIMIFDRFGQSDVRRNASLCVRLACLRQLMTVSR